MANDTMVTYNLYVTLMYAVIGNDVILAYFI